MTAAPPTEEGSLESLVAQVVDEFLERQRRGEQPDPAEYAARHPHAAGVLREVLAALQVVGLSSAAGLTPGGGALGEEGAATGTLGDFRILREVGRGGMGVVYEAEQISLGRRVALKVLPLAGALDPRQLQRFKNEAQAAAHLQHQNIVPVYFVGCERGVHFYAMQFIEGQTLAAVVQELRRLAKPPAPGGPAASAPVNASASEVASGRWAPPRPTADPAPAVDHVPASPGETTTQAAAALSTERSAKGPAFNRTVAGLGVQAAEALEYAHQAGVVHRDVKPANLLLDAGGRVWVADFGLARLGTDAGLTMSGDLLGTLRYMSPEQALGQRVPVDHRTDVYSLGATLYELLTLEPAYGGRSREEVLRHIAFEEPRSPRRLNPAVPAELETIVLKALAKNPAERYATAQALADDLRRYLEDRPIKARRPSLRQRVAKWARRHKSVVRAAGAVMLLAVVALAVSTVSIWRANEDLNRANDKLKQSLERERQNAYYQRIALAEREYAANNLNRMQQLLEECPEELRGWEWHYLNRLRYKTLAPLRHDAAVLCAVFSPDGRRIASSDQDGWVKLWDAQTGRELLKFRAHKEHARSVAFSPDGRRLATAIWDGTVQVWDAQALDKDPAAPPLLTLKGHDGLVRHVSYFR
jgi:serine/threonine protein kinase